MHNWKSEQVDQLYFTWASTGFGDTIGFRLRAASEGVADITSPRYNTIKPYLSYFLPKGTDPNPEKATTEKSPIGLVYGQSGEEYVLAQKVYTGRDAYERTGVYFVHLLVGLPVTFVAQDAIKMWHATNFWQYWKVTDDPGPELRYLSPMTLDAIKQTFNATIDQQMCVLFSGLENFLARIIQAYLFHETQKLFIAGTPEQVAAIVWALTRSVPRTMQRNLTFSTYEQDVLRASVRVVGTCRPQTAQLKGYIMPSQLLPVECYSRGMVIDWDKQQIIGVKDVSQDLIYYSNVVSKRLLSGDGRKLQDDFLDLCEQKNVRDIKKLLYTFTKKNKFAGSDPLTQDDILQCLAPKDKEDITKDEEDIIYLFEAKAQMALLNFAVADPSWWNEQVAPIIQSLMFKDIIAQALRALGNRIAIELSQAMLQQETNKAVLLRSMLLTVTPPTHDNVPWILLLKRFQEYMTEDKSFHPTTAFDWNTRVALLSHWLVCYWAYEQEKREKEQQGPTEHLWNEPVDEKLIYLWLCLQNWDEFKDILENIERYKKQRAKTNQNGQESRGDVFPSQWFDIAFKDLLLRSDEKSLPKWVIEIFNPKSYYNQLMRILIQMMQSPENQFAVLLYFHKLAESRYKDIPLVLITLINAASLSDEMEGQFFAAAQLNSRKRTELLENYLPQILPDEQTPVLPELMALIDDYLNELTLDRLEGGDFPAICETLRLLRKRQTKLPTEVHRRIYDWYIITRDFPLKSQPSLKLESASLQDLNEAIIGIHLARDKHFKTYKEDLLFVLVQNIASNDITLGDVLTSLSPALGRGSRQTLLQELATCFGRRYTSKVPNAWFKPYIHMALSLYKYLKQNSEVGSKSFWDSYLEPLFKRVDSKTFNQINQIVLTGPYAQEWMLFEQQIRSHSKQFLSPGNIVRGVENVANAAGAAFSVAGAVVQQAVDVVQQQRPEGQFKQIPSEQIDAGDGNRDFYPDAEQNGNPDKQDNLAQSRQPQPSFQQPNEQVVPYPPEEPPADATNNLIPNNVPSDPVSIVNGQRIPGNRTQMVYDLKDLYIQIQLAELEKLYQEFTRQKQDVTWIIDERNELQQCHTREETLRVLEHDVFIQQEIKQYREATQASELDLIKPLKNALQQVKSQSDYARRLGKYSDVHMSQVILVFLRYHALAYFLQQHKLVSIRAWLERQRMKANIQRDWEFLERDGA